MEKPIINKKLMIDYMAKNNLSIKAFSYICKVDEQLIIDILDDKLLAVPYAIDKITEVLKVHLRDFVIKFET